METGQGDRVWEGRIKCRRTTRTTHTRTRDLSAKVQSKARDEAPPAPPQAHTHARTHASPAQEDPLQPTSPLTHLILTSSAMAARIPRAARTAVQQAINLTAAAGPSRIAAAPRIVAPARPQSSASSLSHRSFSTGSASRNAGPPGGSAPSNLPDQGSDKLRKTLADLIADSIKVSSSLRSLRYEVRI